MCTANLLQQKSYPQKNSKTVKSAIHETSKFHVLFSCLLEFMCFIRAYKTNVRSAFVLYTQARTGGMT